MKHSAWLEYQQLEQISPNTQIRLGKPTLWLKFEQILQVILRRLIEPSELRVWYYFDENENIWWSAYDPKSNSSISQVSEEEIRAWIEGHY